jgi:hypothetical protein
MAYIPPRSGDLRHSLRADRQSTEIGEAGSISTAWATLVPRFAAKITGQRGSEEVQSARLSGISRFDIVARNSPELAALTSADRLVSIEPDATVYAIKWVGSLDPQSRYLHILCETGGVTDGAS